MTLQETFLFYKFRHSHLASLLQLPTFLTDPPSGEVADLKPMLEKKDKEAGQKRSNENKEELLNKKKLLATPLSILVSKNNLLPLCQQTLTGWGVARNERGMWADCSHQLNRKLHYRNIVR